MPKHSIFFPSREIMVSRINNMFYPYLSLLPSLLKVVITPGRSHWHAPQTLRFLSVWDTGGVIRPCEHAVSLAPAPQLIRPFCSQTSENGSGQKERSLWHNQAGSHRRWLRLRPLLARFLMPETSDRGMEISRGRLVDGPISWCCGSNQGMVFLSA